MLCRHGLRAKCEVISVTRKKNLITYPYHIHDHHLKHVDYGVHITSDFRWDKHIDNICSRANSSLGFIRRNVFNENLALTCKTI